MITKLKLDRLEGEGFDYIIGVKHRQDEICNMLLTEHGFEEDYEISKEEYNEYFVPLIKNKVIKKLEVPSEEIDYESPEYDKKLEELEKTFVCLENLDKEILKKVFFTVMVLDGVFGHFFLLLKKEHLSDTA
mgnify:CR=1 FL=1